MSLPALVLLPGMMCDARMYAPQIEALKDIAECQVGYLGGADNIAEIAKQVLLNAPEKFALAGLSMGGIVAMEVARQAPQRVTRLALMDTNPWVEEDDVKATRNRQIYAAEAGQLEQLLRETMVPRYLANPYSLLTELCVQMGLTLGKDVFIRQSLALQTRHDQKVTLANFNKPCLVLMGEEDELCPIDRHECMVALLPQVAFVKIANAGHIPTLEKPAATNAALKQWMVQ
jgi:pimeloyl-ACP methyl ester carboxylesterase|tara:strand:+ start:816 stop:1508 length:693 start_codon:yes stop_codon:yes gene_type:complete